jgi:hypothetical protein
MPRRAATRCNDDASQPPGPTGLAAAERDVVDAATVVVVLVDVLDDVVVTVRSLRGFWSSSPLHAAAEVSSANATSRAAPRLNA